MHDTTEPPPAAPARGVEHFIGNADEFPVRRHGEFFNHAGVCPLPKAAADALRRYAHQAETVAYVDTGWYRDINSLRQSAAAMMNASKEEIAFVKNTSEGLSIVATGVDWRPGDRVVTTAVEYPANVYPWMELARSRGVELVMVPEETDTDDGSRHVPLDKILAAADHPRTRLVTLSHVEYASGQRHDLAAVGAFCRGRNILFCVDAIQSLGVLPVDVGAMHIDYLSADGHKWLLGPEGAGVFYCRKELIEHTRPATLGWMNVVDAQNYGNYDYTLRPDAGRFECGSYNLPGLLALKASVELLMGLGVEAVSARLKALTDRLIKGLREKGYGIVSPRSGERWSGIMSFVANDATQHQATWARLRGQYNTEIAVREGRLRASPHFYNTEAQIDRLVDRLPEP
jgi:cysteine desulfurase / selenocysteine lyase